jgi:hypothetical protein
MNEATRDLVETSLDTDLTIGPRALDAYSRLSYTMWYALAEFVDNSTQSRLNYERVVDEVLQTEGKPLQIDITYNKTAREIRVEDNSIGMNKETLIDALKIAAPTKDSKGRSRYGMGMKTAACWLGRKWKIVTCEWGSGIEWTAEVDVEAIAYHGARVPLTPRAVGTDDHYTKIIITEMRRNIQARTESTLMDYLGSMYMFDLKPIEGGAVPPVKITYNTAEIAAPSEYEWDTDPDGKPYLREIPEGTKIGTKSISGWVGVLKKGGRKYGGFSLFQNRRQIQGFPNAWKPRSIFGGVDDEGANNLVSQRLTGVLLFDHDFSVSHTKDAILFDDAEEDQLEKFLVELTKDYRLRAVQRRGDRIGRIWSGEKLRELIEGLKPEFMSTEMKDAVNTAQLPPIDAIVASNRQRVDELAEADTAAVFPVTGELTVKVSIREVSEYEPYVTISTGAEAGVIHVLINGLHPYYQTLETQEAIEECITQFTYDAVAEYRAGNLIASPVLPDSVRSLKDGLMRVRIHQNENANFRVQREAVAALEQDMSTGR